jgi:hypothetical protein
MTARDVSSPEWFGKENCRRQSNLDDRTKTLLIARCTAISVGRVYCRIQISARGVRFNSTKFQSIIEQEVIKSKEDTPELMAFHSIALELIDEINVLFRRENA